MTLLTSGQYSKLASYVQNEDRIGYYGYLASLGDNYAPLALGVVDHSTAQGAIANQYALLEAEYDGTPIGSNARLTSIGLALMEADFLQRATYGLSMSVDVIRQYHVDVFRSFNLTADVWTAYTPLDAVGIQGQDALWTRCCKMTSLLPERRQGGRSLTPVDQISKLHPNGLPSSQHL